MSALDLILIISPIMIAFGLLVVALIKRVDRLEAKLVESERKRKMGFRIWDRFQEEQFRKDFQLKNLHLPPVEAGLIEDTEYYKRMQDFGLSVEEDLQMQLPKSEVYEAISEAFPNTTEVIRRHEGRVKAYTLAKQLIEPENKLLQLLLAARVKRR